VLAVALELESKGRYVVAIMGGPVMGIVPSRLAAVLDTVPPPRTDTLPPGFCRNW